MVSPLNLNVSVPWTRVLALSGIECQVQSLPATVKCPFCGKHLLGIYEDRVCGGQWFACRSCRRAGDMIELAAKVCRLSIPAVVLRLAKQGITIDTKAIDGYLRKHVEYRRQICSLWREARQGLLHTSTSCHRLVHELGLECDVQQDRWDSGPGQLFGGLTKFAVEKAFHPATAHRKSRLNTSQYRVFQGVTWGDVLTIPFYDLPGRICAFLFIGRNGDPERDFVFRRVVLQPAKINPPFEAGLALHPDALATTVNWGNRVVAFDDVITALRVQLRHFEQSTRPLPIVCWHECPARKPRVACRTRFGWKQLYGRKPVFWFPTACKINEATLHQVLISGGRISRTNPEGGDDRLRKYLSRHLPRDLVKKLIGTSLPWPEAISKMIATMDDPTVENMFLRLELDGLARSHVLGKAKPETRERVERIFANTETLDSTIRITSGTVIEQDGGWHYVSNQGRSELIVGAILRIEEIVRHRRSKRRYYKGYVLCQKRKIPFCESAERIDKHPLEWMRELLEVKAKLALVSGVTRTKYLAEIAQQFFAPRVVYGIELIGWDSAKYAFMFPSYSITSVGQVEEHESRFVPEGVPASKLEKPIKLAPADIEAMLPGDLAGSLLWASLACILANILAPVYGRRTCGIGLYGAGAESIGSLVAQAAGCLVFPLGKLAHREVISDNEHRHNWPIVVERGPGRFKRIMSEWIESDRRAGRNCLVNLDWWNAEAKALLGGWNLIFAEAGAALPETALLAVRQFVPAYLRNLCKRQLQLRHWNQNCSWVESVLYDLHRYAIKKTGDADQILDAARYLTPDCESGHAGAFADLLAQLVLNGHVLQVQAGFHDGKTPSVILRKEGLFVGKAMFSRKIYQQYVGAPDLARITLVLDRAGVLVGDEDGGWIIDTDWWQKRFRGERAKQSGLLRVTTPPSEDWGFWDKQA